MIKVRSKRTLKKRIVKSMRWSLFVSNLFFSIVLIILIGLFIKQGGRYYSRYMSTSLAQEISSPYFLKQVKSDKLSDVSAQNNNLIEWLHSVDNKLCLDSIFEDIKPSDIDMTDMPKLPPKRIYIMTVTINLNGTNIYDKNNIINQNDSGQPKNLEDNWVYMRGFINKFHSIFDTTLTCDIKDNDSGKVVGYVTTQFNDSLLLDIMGGLFFLILSISFGAFFVAKLFSKALSKSILKPIDKLLENMKAIAEDDIERVLNSNIVIKKPVLELEQLVGYTNQIVMKIKDYAKTLEDQNFELEAMTSTQQETNEALGRRNNHLQNILNNVGQGFLAFGADLNIYNDCSLQCKMIFERTLCGKRLSELIYDDFEQQEFMDSLFLKLFNEEDSTKLDLYIHLLPEEIMISGRNISLDYKIVTNIKSSHKVSIMVILTDITEKRLLQRKMEEEKNILKMVVKAVVNTNDFISCIEEYNRFSTCDINKIMDSDRPINEKIADIFRNVHNFKGNFSQYDVENIVSKLHEMESFISELKGETADSAERKLREYIQNNDLCEWIEEDTNIIKSYLGDNFFERKDTVLIDKTILMNVEEKMLKLLPYDEFKTLLPYIRRLRYKSFKELIGTYPAYVEKLSQRLDKPILPMIVEGEDILIDQEYYRDFTKSLVHVFRNNLDHGIESMEERVEAGKGEIGSIRCNVSLENSCIKLSISDDGGGIDIEKVKQKAIEKGLIMAEESYTISEKEALSLIFKEQFSLKDEVTETSGRGIGLYSVKKEVEKLNGTVEVNTVINEGTEFVFTIPIQNVDYVPQISIEEVVKFTSGTGIDFINDLTGLTLQRNYNIINIDKVSLNKVSSIISIRGALNGIMIISFNEQLAYKLVKNFIIDEIDDTELESYMEDVAAECSNIIIGNSLKNLDEVEDFVTIGAPTIICYNGASIKYTNAAIISSSIKIDEYEVSFSFVSNNEQISGGVI